MNLWLKDPKTGQRSVTLSVFIYGFLTVTTKLFISGIQLTETIKLEPFSGVEYAACIASLGGIYVLRKNSKKEDKKE